MQYSTEESVGQGSTSDDNPPVSPITPIKKLQSVVSYQVFVLEQKSIVSGKYPFLQAHQINGKLRKMWETLPSTEKNNYRKFTLISVPTPQKKTPQEGKNKKSKGRLLTLKSHQGRQPRPKSQQGRQRTLNSNQGRLLTPNSDDGKWPCNKWGDLCHEGENNSVTNIEPEKQLEDESGQIDSPIDTNQPGLQEEESHSKSQESLWSNMERTYIKTRYRVNKNYPVPKVIQDKRAGSVEQPGILKRPNMENKRAASRVSFSTEDVQVKIMSQSEKEDSISAESCSQEEINTRMLYSPRICKQSSLQVRKKSTLPSPSTSPYDFDAIDQFEMCMDTPKIEGKFLTRGQSVEKRKVTQKSRSKASMSLRGAITKQKKTEKPKGKKTKKNIENVPLQSKRKKTRLKHGHGQCMLRSRSSVMHFISNPHNSEGSVEEGETPPPPGYIYHYNELSSSPDHSDNDLGRDDTKNSFREDGHSNLKSDLLDMVTVKVEAKRRGKLYTGGDHHAEYVGQLRSRELITPSTVEGSKSSENAGLAPRKTKQLNYTKKENKSPNVVKQVKSKRNKRQKQTMSMAETEMANLDVGILRNRGIKENGNANLENATKKMDKLIADAYLESEHVNQYGSGLNDFFHPKSVYTTESVLDENSSSPDVGISPLMLQTRSRLTVAETVRSMKLIASPDHVDSPPLTMSAASPKLLSPTLSDISMLSSVSSCSSSTAERKDKLQPKQTVHGGSMDVDNTTRLRDTCTRTSGRVLPQQHTLQMKARSMTAVQEDDKSCPANKPAATHKIPSGTNILSRTLCEMFQNRTPPEESTRRKSSRRVVSSAGDEGMSNFAKLFEEQDIFG